MNRDLSGRVVVSLNVLDQGIADESVLLDLVSEKYFGLNDTGTRMWQLMQSESDLRGVVHRIIAEFNVKESEVVEDLWALVDAMVDGGLISVEAPVSEEAGP